MKKNINFIKTVFAIGIIFILIIASYVTISSAREPIYNAKVNIGLQWSDDAFEEPVVPRKEIVTLNISVILEIKTGESFGAGLLDGYRSSTALINLQIIDHPSWCYPALKYDLLETNISELSVAKTQVFLNINENAPAYGEGFIKFRVKVVDLGLIKGDDQTFTLSFKPAYFPLIKTELPEFNTMQINPNSKAVFPIKVENAGNAKTKVFFEVENVPEGWSAAIRDSVVLGETSGSEETIYLTVIPSNDFGYHHEDAIINIKITPTFADNIEQVGTTIYGYFIVRSRGFSSGGLEFYLLIAIIILIIIAIFIYNFKKKTYKKKTWLEYLKSILSK